MKSRVRRFISFVWVLVCKAIVTAGVIFVTGHYSARWWVAQEDAIWEDVVARYGVIETGDPITLAQLVAAAARRHRVNPYLVAANIRIESAGNNHAQSNKGAVGYGQLMPATAQAVCGLKPDERRDPEKSVDCSTKYFRQLLTQYGDDPKAALWAYNGGPRAVEVIRRCGETNAKCLGGYTESVAHARKVIREWTQMQEVTI